jgi:hypothetical protein
MFNLEIKILRIISIQIIKLLGEFLIIILYYYALLFLLLFN